MSTLPPWVYEIVVAPAAFGLAFWHGRRTLGAARAAVELLALTLYGYALERVAIAVFASHGYGPGWRAAPGGVPLAVAACWAAVILSAMALGRDLGFTSPLGRAAAAAVLALTLDLLMEPVAMRVGLWAWTPPGPWLGVPVGNFVGWAVIVGAYAWGAERWGDASSPLLQMLRRAALAAVCVASLLVVGAAWRAMEAEAAFRGIGGWLVWAGILILAGRLARRRPGLAPAGVLLAIAAPFVIDAALVGDRLLGVAVLGPLLVLTRAALARPRLISETASAGW